MSSELVCPNCEKRFRVPPLPKAWKCKVCQVELVPLEADDEEYEDEDRLDYAGEDAEHAAFRSPRVRIDAHGNQGRKLERKELAKLDWLRVVFAVLLWLSVLQGVLLVLVVGGIPWVGATLLAPAFGFTLLQVGLFYSAHRSLVDPKGHPFVWVLCLALLSLCLAILQLSKIPIGGLPIAIDLGLGNATGFQVPVGTSQVLLTIGLFFCLASAHRVNQLRRDYALEFEGDARNSAHRGRRPKTTPAKPTLALWHLLVPLSLLMGVRFGFWYAAKPTDPKATIEAFQTSWNASDLQALAALAETENQSKWQARLAKRAERFGWGDGLPHISKWALGLEKEVRTEVFYATDQGNLVVHFVWKEGRWTMNSVGYGELDR